MIVPLPSLLQAAEPWIPTVLVPPEVWKVICALGERLPAAFSWVILECRLVRGAEQVDLSLSLEAREGGREAIAAALSEKQAYPGLGKVRDFLRAWSRPDTLLYDSIPQIGLEIDLPGTAPTEPDSAQPAASQATDPSAQLRTFFPRDASSPTRKPRDPIAFVCLDPHPTHRPPGPPVPFRKKLGLAESSLALLDGAADPLLLKTLERCARRLPPGGRVLHIASLAPRGLRALRLDAEVPHANIGEWLQAIGWPGQIERLERLLELLGPGWGRNNVELDLAEGIGSPLGILFFPLPPLSRYHASGWERIFEVLVRLGACTPSRAQAAMAWLGQKTIVIETLGWPVNLQRSMGMKLTALADGRLEAKVYLCFYPHYVLF